jgi:hypothetical protein
LLTEAPCVAPTSVWPATHRFRRLAERTARPGLRVAEVVPTAGGPAGIHEGDIVLTAAGQPIASAQRCSGSCWPTRSARNCHHGLSQRPRSSIVIATPVELAGYRRAYWASDASRVTRARSPGAAHRATSLGSLGVLDERGFVETGHAPTVTRSILAIVGLSSIRRSVTVASVCTESGGSGLRKEVGERHREARACAAAISCSGLEPGPSSKRI